MCKFENKLKISPHSSGILNRNTLSNITMKRETNEYEESWEVEEQRWVWSHQWEIGQPRTYNQSKHNIAKTSTKSYGRRMKVVDPKGKRRLPKVFKGQERMTFGNQRVASIGHQKLHPYMETYSCTWILTLIEAIHESYIHWSYIIHITCFLYIHIH